MLGPRIFLGVQVVADVKRETVSAVSDVQHGRGLTDVPGAGWRIVPGQSHTGMGLSCFTTGAAPGRVQPTCVCLCSPSLQFPKWVSALVIVAKISLSESQL